MAGTRFGRSQESGEAVAGVCALAGVATVVAAITNVFEGVSSVLSGVLAVLTGVSCLVANFSQEGLAFMWSFSPVRGMLGSPWPVEKRVCHCGCQSVFGELLLFHFLAMAHHCQLPASSSNAQDAGKLWKNITDAVAALRCSEKRAGADAAMIKCQLH